MSDFKGKTVLITGGAKGIGKAIALEFVRQKANIIITYKQTKVEDVQDVLEEFRDINHEVKTEAYQVDVSRKDETEGCIQSILEKFNTIDILVNNAGINEDSLLMLMNEERWDSVIKTNLYGTYYMTHNVLPTMIENRQGVIINISSVSGIYGTAGQANYGAAKAGILLFSSALSKEVAGKNIRVNAVAPGFIETDMTKALTEEFCKKKLKEIPMKRFGKAEEIAKVVIFLASNDASYISGQTIVVDGGLT